VKLGESFYMNSRFTGSTAILKLFILSAISLTSCHLLAQDQEPIGQHYDIPIVLDSNEIGMSQPEVVDINGDGRKDVVFSSMDLVDVDGEAPLEIWTGNESGGMELSTDVLIDGGIPSSLRGFRQVLPADFNGDGRLDLFMESHGPEWDCGNGTAECWPGGQNNLLLSDNDGKLNNVTNTHLPAFSDFSHGSAVLDFDSDGDMDIFVANAGGGGSDLYDPGFSYLLENDGSGKFVVVADGSEPWQDPIVGRNGIFPEDDWIPGTSGWAVAVDANGDGHTDLSFGRTEGYYIEGSPLRTLLALNDGNGVFDYVPGDAYPAPSWAEVGGNQHSLVYDLNNDGLDDLLLEATGEDFTKPWIQVLISNGDGTFRDETSTRIPYQEVDIVGDFQLHDLDGDGHPDLFNDINWGQVNVRVNDGEGNFRLLSKDWVEMSESWVVLDVDNDGGTDFFESSYLGVRLHKMNLPYGAEMDGTADDDRLIGGAHDNVYRGFEGDDVLDGGLGDDDLDGGTGNDELIGGKGNDYLVPGSGTNTIDGGPGNDEI
jgi:Ca2+-binding RTX toxin-like protein